MTDVDDTTGNTAAPGGDGLAALTAQLDRMGVEHKTAEQSAIVVLPGTRKLKTVCLLTPAPDSLLRRTTPTRSLVLRRE